jgi:CrcB protein
MGPLMAIGLGGFAGAVVRYLLDGWLTDLTGAGFPWGTLLINVSGSVLIGLLFALMTERAAIRADLRGPLMIGFLGSYTTFSTLALESWRMLEDGAWLEAGFNLGGSLVLGVVAVLVGVIIGRLV